MTQPLLLDNTVLSNFAAVNRVDLVIRLWTGGVCTTSSALAEYNAAVARGVRPAGTWTDLPVVVLSEAEGAYAASLPRRLGAGERTCIAVAAHRQSIIATDDWDAREAARQRGVPVTGTLGILILCVRQCLLNREEANLLLSKMIAAGYRSPVDSLDSLLDQ